MLPLAAGRNEGGHHGSRGSTYYGVDYPGSRRQAKTARVQATLMFHFPWGSTVPLLELSSLDLEIFDLPLTQA